MTVECKPCNQFCRFDIIQIDCEELREGFSSEHEAYISKTKTTRGGREDACYACFRILGSGVVEPSCNLWQLTTNINPNPQTIAINQTEVLISYTDNVGASSYTLNVFQCDQPGCSNNSREETFFDLCGLVERPEGRDLATMPRDFSPEFTYRVQPNPFSESLEVECSGAKDHPVQISLIDINGQLILNAKDLNAEKRGDSSFILPTQHLPAGVYFLNLKSGTFNETRKLIKVQ